MEGGDFKFSKHSFTATILIYVVVLCFFQPLLYSYFRSSCSWRVRIGKAQLCYNYVCASPGQEKESVLKVAGLTLCTYHWPSPGGGGGTSGKH